MSAIENTGGERRQLFETRIYGLIPAPAILVTALFAGLIFAGYVGLCVIHDVAVIQAGGLTSNAAIALILSLLLGAALDLPERARRIWIHEADALKATLDKDAVDIVDGLAVGQPVSITGSLWLWFGAGAAFGLTFNAVSVIESGSPLIDYIGSVNLWALIVNPLLFGLGGRAFRLMREDDQTISTLVRTHLVVDFANAEPLQVYGRLGVKNALIWLVLAALVLAFLAVEASFIASAIAFSLAVAASVWAMMTVTRPVAAKLDHARSQVLLDVRRRLVSAANDPNTPPGTVADLAAYETWISGRPVWPISAPITRRLALYGLIPVLAWFGAAAAELVLRQLV